MIRCTLNCQASIISAAFTIRGCYWAGDAPRCYSSDAFTGSHSTSLTFGFAVLVSGEQLVIDLFVLIHRHAFSFVVHADEDAQDVWLEIERVLLPAFCQIEHGVATDATIDEGEVAICHHITKLRGNDERAAVAQDVIRVRTAATIAIRDRVTLKLVTSPSASPIRRGRRFRVRRHRHDRVLGGQ